MKIIAIPFAGGDRNAFRAFSKYIPTGIEWITLELPGRGRRFANPLVKNIHAATNDLFAQIKPHISKEPYMIYGHSMGTLLGYELTKRIREEQLNMPVCLYFTGRGAPGAKEVEIRSSLPPEQFWDRVRKMGGLPEEILAHNELLELYYPILSSDFKIIEDYVYTPLEEPLSIPIFVTMGTNEIGDDPDKTTKEQAQKWQEETSKLFTYNELPGDHFFILKHPELLMGKVTRTFMNVLRAH